MVPDLDGKNLTGRNPFQLVRKLTGTVFDFEKCARDFSL
jgi:hypothetical protein